MIENEYTIVNIREYHLDNDAVLAYSATLVSKATGKRMDVELSENAQGIAAYNRATDVLYPLVTEKKHIKDLGEGEVVEIIVAVPRTDL